jgi:Domain of unknown function (DUF4157)
MTNTDMLTRAERRQVQRSAAATQRQAVDADSPLAQLQARANAGPHATALASLQATVAQRVANNRTGLPDCLRAGLESLSGRDLSGIRVHYNSPKPAQLAAHAFAQGSDIHLAPGQERHLPHEGWHAVQQMEGRVRPTMQFQGTAINDDTALEREAATMGARAERLTPVHRVPHTAHSGRAAMSAPFGNAIVQRAGDVRLGVGTFNIAHLGDTTDREVKRDKLDAVRDLFSRNGWLELLVLQEVNGEKALENLNSGINVYAGPHMSTISVTGSHSYSEFYPLLIREGSGWEVDDIQTFVESGELKLWHKDAAPIIFRDRSKQGEVENTLRTVHKIAPPPGTKNRDMWYNKQRKDWSTDDEQSKLLQQREQLSKEQSARPRPVVIYRLKKGDERVNVAVVHTSPAGAEFGRKVVYEQIEQFLAHADNAAGDDRQPGNQNWVILGDFYLTPEADITAHSNIKTRTTRFGHLFPDSVTDQMDNPPKTRYSNLSILHAFSGSNWPSKHEKKGDLAKVQIADFFIHSKSFKSHTAGAFSWHRSGILPADPDHTNLKKWIKISDHVPIGAYLSTRKKDLWAEQIRKSATDAAFHSSQVEEIALKGLAELRGKQIDLHLSQTRTKLVELIKKIKRFQSQLTPKQLGNIDGYINGVVLRVNEITYGAEGRDPTLKNIIEDVSIEIREAKDIVKRLQNGFRKQNVERATETEGAIDLLGSIKKLQLIPARLLNRRDAQCFITTTDLLPEGFFNEFTHNIPAMLSDFFKQAGTQPIPKDLASVERNLAVSMSFKSLLESNANAGKMVSDEEIRQIIVAHRYKAPLRTYDPELLSPLQFLEEKGYTRKVDQSNPANSILSAIYDQLETQWDWIGSFLHFIGDVQTPDLPNPHSTEDILKDGEKILAAVQEYLVGEQRNALQNGHMIEEVDGPYIRIDLWSVTRGGKLEEHPRIAEKAGRQPGLMLTLYFEHDGQRGRFSSLVR